ncbi:cardiolipin synthase ClsB [Leptothrix discophora]|uniref:Cardiolipin synthase B n=1 Tax=Leptothrix discophora TaxID=89 RepID=A0ABT9G6E1_LEPDI|nr:cardiolipin synthase ClsB [Leptothrix discophora]MDP4301832.1 cardiolipin synthase ClsB [Leptothrix discophora]
MTTPAPPLEKARHRLRRGRYGWYLQQRPVLQGGHRITLLRGGEQLFPAMRAAIDAAQHEVWLATYIFNDDDEALAIADALVAAAARGVRVRVVIDGFGTKHSRSRIERRLSAAPGVVPVPSGRSARRLQLAVFRPIERWTHWLQPGQLRRLHMKLCTVDDTVGYIGGINLIDDRIDLNHGRTEAPRLDYALAVHGPVVDTMAQVVRAMWSRAWHGRDWRDALRRLIVAPRPVQRLRTLMRELRMPMRPGTQAGSGEPVLPATLQPVQAALVVRDNLRQRRTIERACIEAMRGAQRRIWLVTPYFYPGTDFRQALADAARRGVEVRLLLQGKADYRLAAWAARALYRELHLHGVHVHEYLPAFLHAKVMLIDDDWCTVGSSNIDPLSLLLNLEANLIVSDAGFHATLATELSRAFADSREILPDSLREGSWMRLVRRAVVAWVAYVYLRVAGVTGRY